MDYITVIFLHFEFMFLYYQSSGHMKCGEDSRIVNKMNLSYGGTVLIIHDTEIKEMGPYKRLLNVNSRQRMNFTDHDSGPSWMSSMERLSKN